MHPRGPGAGQIVFPGRVIHDYFMKSDGQSTDIYVTRGRRRVGCTKASLVFT